MADETTGTTAVAELSPDDQLEKDLGALLGTEKPAEAKPSGETAPPAESVPAPEATPPEETLEAKLAKIDETPAKVEPEAPKLSDEQQRILSIVPNAQVAEQVTQVATAYQHFTGAFERGDFDSVEEMLRDWKPDAYEAFLEHIYQKNVGTEKWLNRWMDERDGKVPNSPALRSMQQQIAQLRASLQQQEQQKVTQAQQDYNNRIAHQYVSHIDGLFKQIGFSEADQPLVREIIDKRVAANMAVRQAIHSGNTQAVNVIFKQAVNDYVKRDQALATSRQVHDPAGVRKPLVPGTAVTQEGLLPSDVKQVPKEKLDDWLDQELASLQAKQRR